MPDSYFSKEKGEDLSLRSTLTSVVEIMNYNYFLESDKLHELQLFYQQLAYEIYHMRLKNYGYGLEAIQPEITILSDRIYLYSDLHLEKDVPELQMMVFKIFVETLNLLLAIGLKHELAIRGFAGPDTGVRSLTTSGIAPRAEFKDRIFLADMLKVFSFDQIFPDELDQKFAPSLNFMSLHSGHFLHANSMLKEISAVGIYFPEKISKCPYAEVAIFSDMLIETNLEENMHFVCNWQNWAVRNAEKFPVEELSATIVEGANGDENIFGSMWRKFREIG